MGDEAPYYFSEYRSSERDVFALRKICKTWVKERGFWPFDAVIETLSKRECVLLYAKENLEAEFWAGAVFAINIFEVCEIIYIYVVPEKRKRGLGKLLLEKFILLERASRGVSTITLEVRISNNNAQKLYEKFGFKKIGTRKKYYLNGEDALTYKMDIQG